MAAAEATAAGSQAIAWRACSLPGLEDWERVEFVTEGVEGARTDPRTWPRQTLLDFWNAIERWQGDHPAARVRAMTFATGLEGRAPQLIVVLHYALPKA
jgi:hypothetical protein